MESIEITHFSALGFSFEYRQIEAVCGSQKCDTYTMFCIILSFCVLQSDVVRFLHLF